MCSICYNIENNSMKNILIVITLGLVVSCSPKFDKDFTVEKNDKNYKMWITYYNAEKIQYP